MLSNYFCLNALLPLPQKKFTIAKSADLSFFEIEICKLHIFFKFCSGSTGFYSGRGYNGEKDCETMKFILNCLCIMTKLNKSCFFKSPLSMLQKYV